VLKHLENDIPLYKRQQFTSYQRPRKNILSTSSTIKKKQQIKTISENFTNILLAERLASAAAP